MACTLLLVGSPSSGPSVAARADSNAKTQANIMLAAVASCFAHRHDYARCMHPVASGVTVGSGRGDVEVTAATDWWITIVAHSQSGTNFSIHRATFGDDRFRCDRPGQGTCRKGGRW